MVKQKTKAEQTKEAEQALEQTQPLGPLMFNISIVRETGRLGVCHTIQTTDSDGSKDIELILQALTQMMTDLRESQIQLRVQSALADREQKVSGNDD